MSNKLNSKPFELVGFTVEDYLYWCGKQKRKNYIRESKKEFFKLVLEKRLIKKENSLYLNGEKI